MRLKCVSKPPQTQPQMLHYHEDVSLACIPDGNLYRIKSRQPTYGSCCFCCKTCWCCCNYHVATITMCSSLDMSCSQTSSVEASKPVAVLGGTCHWDALMHFLLFRSGWATVKTGGYELSLAPCIWYTHPSTQFPLYDLQS